MKQVSLVQLFVLFSLFAEHYPCHDGESDSDHYKQYYALYITGILHIFLSDILCSVRLLQPVPMLFCILYVYQITVQHSNHMPQSLCGLNKKDLYTGGYFVKIYLFGARLLYTGSRLRVINLYNGGSANESLHYRQDS